ncbi:hypothetical protein NUW58_g10885 [Xylaria curta]|uniref:Uncharacterized protein n=1 Tax=Xylaria curta TaxID=42375 RepID=A0ACC1MFL5_9PEZI|nr:hypothetical protein NUW58_g10885 [Xylaria curta]
MGFFVAGFVRDAAPKADDVGDRDLVIPNGSLSNGSEARMTDPDEGLNATADNESSDDSEGDEWGGESQRGFDPLATSLTHLIVYLLLSLSTLFMT